MEKKSQVSLFVIIGIIVLVIAGFLIFRFRSPSRTAEFTDELSFSGREVDTYVESCVESAVLKGLDYHGFEDEGLDNFIESEILGCVDDFSDFEQYEIEFDPPTLNSEFNEETIIFEVDFPIRINKGSSHKDLDRFTYSFDKSATLKVEGSIPEGTEFRSQDNKAKLAFNQDTQAYNKNTGEDVGFVSFKMRDKHALGLENSLVISNYLYEGKPAGAVFEPAIEVTISLSEVDLIGVNPEVLRLAYYDEYSGIWVAYPTVYDEETNSIIGYVDHFSLIAVTVCAEEGKESQIIPINAFHDPFGETCSPEKWNVNTGPVGDPGENYGIHLKPEYMEELDCDFGLENSEIYEMKMFFDNKKFTVEDCEFTAENTDYFQDWDKDDQEVTEANRYVSFRATGAQGELSDMSLSADGNENEISARNSCIEACEIYAEEKVREKFSWIPEGYSYEGQNWIKENNAGNEAIYCTFKYSLTDTNDLAEEYEISKPDIMNNAELSDFACDHEIIDANFNNLDSGDMESDAIGFFATPPTFGFSKKVEKNLKGYGTVEVEIKDNGEACLDSNNQEEQVLVTLILDKSTENAERKLFATNKEQEVDLEILLTQDFDEEGNQLLFPEYSKDQLVESTWSCSDHCRWFFNAELNADINEIVKDEGISPDAGTIIAANGADSVSKNKIGVNVISMQDACMYANSYIEIRGKGIDLVRPNNQEDCAKVDSCWVEGQCILKGETTGGYCCCGANDGYRRDANGNPFSYPHLEKGDCTNDIDYPPKSEEECNAKNGCWLNENCYPSGHMSGNFCCVGPADLFGDEEVSPGYGRWKEGEACQRLREEKTLCDNPEENCKLRADCPQGIDFSSYCDVSTLPLFCCPGEKEAEPGSTEDSSCTAIGGICMQSCISGHKEDASAECSSSLKCCIPEDTPQPTCDPNACVIYDKNNVNNVNGKPSIIANCKYCCDSGDIECNAGSYEGEETEVDCDKKPYFNTEGSATYGDAEEPSTLPWKCEEGEVFSATCGDGETNALLEDCDDGNDNPDDGCDNNCKSVCTDWSSGKNYENGILCSGKSPYVCDENNQDEIKILGNKVYHCDSLRWTECDINNLNQCKNLGEEHCKNNNDCRWIDDDCLPDAQISDNLDDEAYLGLMC